MNYNNYLKLIEHQLDVGRIANSTVKFEPEFDAVTVRALRRDNYKEYVHSFRGNGERIKGKWARILAEYNI